MRKTGEEGTVTKEKGSTGIVTKKGDDISVVIKEKNDIDTNPAMEMNDAGTDRETAHTVTDPDNEAPTATTNNT